MPQSSSVRIVVLFYRSINHRPSIINQMTDWESRYLDGDTPWDKGAPAPPLIEMLERLAGSLDWNDVLVPGCGFGHDVRAIASKGVRVLGIDLAETAVDGARNYPLAGHESYRLADLFDRSWWTPAGFGGWWEHTCFCAIDPSLRLHYAEAAGALVRPGGWLCGVFFLTPHDPGDEDAGPPFRSSVAEIDDLLAPWFDRVDGWVPAVAYPGREGREWTAIYRRRI